MKPSKARPDLLVIVSILFFLSIAITAASGFFNTAKAEQPSLDEQHVSQAIKNMPRIR